MKAGSAGTREDAQLRFARRLTPLLHKKHLTCDDNSVLPGWESQQSLHALLNHFELDDTRGGQKKGRG